jgi:cation:H+ antiporter
MVLQQLALIILAFLGLWYGSGLIIDSVKNLARKIRVPPFAFSFFVLGLLTSVPETAVGLNAISERRPEIFVGNLLGGIIIMFLLIIPLLAVLHGKVHVRRHLNNKNLLVLLGVIAAPVVLSLDRAITSTDGFILITLYVALFYIVRTKTGALARAGNVMLKDQKDLRHSIILKLLAGIALVFVTSRYIVNETIDFSEAYGVSAFLISLVAISIGSNLPEMILTVRSFIKRAEDVALGDYLGSAAANTLLFGIFTIIYGGEVVTDRHLGLTFALIGGSLAAFYLLVRASGSLKRRHGAALMGCYVLFLLFEASRAI